MLEIQDESLNSHSQHTFFFFVWKKTLSNLDLVQFEIDYRETGASQKKSPYEYFPVGNSDFSSCKV